MKKNNVNDNYFDTIDTSDKSYFLGLMFSDGNIDQKRNRISIELQYKDKYIIEAFKDHIQYDGDLNHRNRRNKNSQDLVILRLTSKKIKEDLIKIGCVPAKSLIVEFPKLEIFKNNTLRHFLRGYFDGNGCAAVRKNRKTGGQIIIKGGVKIIKYYKEILEILIESKNMNLSYSKNGLTAILTICKISNLQKIYNLFYDSTDIFLTRKKEKLEQILGINDLLAA